MQNGSDFPTGETDILPAGSTFGESWIAYEEDSTVCGFVWHPGVKEDLQWSRFPHLTTDLGELPPHSIRELEPVYLVCGPGDWQVVREEWKRFVRPSVSGEDLAPPTCRVLTVTTEPTVPAFVREGQETIQVKVQSRRGNALTGTLIIESTKDTEDREDKRQETGDRRQEEEKAETSNVPAASGQWELAEINRTKPFTTAVRVTGIARPGATLVPARVEAGSQVERFTLPVVAVGSGNANELRVEEMANGEYITTNGVVTLRVAAAFRGSLYALETDGVNHLLSGYPTPRPFIWWNPWHGGVYTMLEWGTGEQAMAGAKYEGWTVERVGETGIVWGGAGVSCVPDHKDWNWARVETEYLTTGGSNLVAVLQRFENTSGATKKLHGSVVVWAQPGGTRTHTVAHWERDGERRERRNGAFETDHKTSGWGALANHETGHVLLAATTGRNARLVIEDRGAEGMHLDANRTVTLAPGETKETLTWFIVTRDREQIAAYAHLKDCDKLP